MHSPESKSLLMAKVVNLPTDGTRLYIGEWCRARKVTPAKVSREAPINFGYLSGLISGKKTNPSRDKLEAVARILEVKVGQLYSPPPPEKLLEQIEQHDTDVIMDLLEKRRKAK